MDYPKIVELLAKKVLKNSGFTCIHDRAQNFGNYCDDCPLGGPKNYWSYLSTYFCNKTKNYSK
ncbi:MAG: hypothetical protein WC503_04190 [Candidatus Shapirobacteria bacterium]